MSSELVAALLDNLEPHLSLIVLDKLVATGLADASSTETLRVRSSNPAQIPCKNSSIRTVQVGFEEANRYKKGYLRLSPNK